MNVGNAAKMKFGYNQVWLSQGPEVDIYLYE